MSGWVVVRYDEAGWPSHPDEDLPEDGTPIEMWRGGDGNWCRAEGLIARHEVEGHQTATMRDALATFPDEPPPDMPLDLGAGGVVWRLLCEP